MLRALAIAFTVLALVAGVVFVVFAAGFSAGFETGASLVTYTGRDAR